MTDFIREFDNRAAADAYYMAKQYISNARQLDPSKYPNEAIYRRQFVERAREYWRSYIYHKKAAMQ
jgi:hypothetical protein